LNGSSLNNLEHNLVNSLRDKFFGESSEKITQEITPQITPEKTDQNKEEISSDKISPEKNHQEKTPEKDEIVPEKSSEMDTQSSEKNTQENVEKTVGEKLSEISAPNGLSTSTVLKGAKAVRELQRSFHQPVFEGKQVSAWDNVDPTTKQQQENVAKRVHDQIRQQLPLPNKTRRDIEWDKSLDIGRTKKVKNKVSPINATKIGKQFQNASEKHFKRKEEEKKGESFEDTRTRKRRSQGST